MLRQVGVGERGMLEQLAVVDMIPESLADVHPDARHACMVFCMNCCETGQTLPFQLWPTLAVGEGITLLRESNHPPLGDFP